MIVAQHFITNTPKRMNGLGLVNVQCVWFYLLIDGGSEDSAKMLIKNFNVPSVEI